MTIPARRVVDIERLRALEALAAIAEEWLWQQTCLRAEETQCHLGERTSRWLTVIADRGEPIITPALSAGEEPS